MDIKNIKINLPWKKIFKISGNILFVLVIIVAGLMILSKFSIGGLRVLTVKSGSMSPTIFTGSVAFILPSNNYKVDDIITFRAQGQKELVTHRIAEIDQSTSPTSYRTKGDANDSSDFYKVPQNGVVGKVFFSIPLLGYVIEFAKTPVGLILLIVIPATVIIYEEIRKIKNEWKKVKREKQKKGKLTTQTESIKESFDRMTQQPNNSTKEKIWTVLTKHRKIFVLFLILSGGLLFFHSASAVTETAGDLTVSYPGDPPFFNQLNLAPGDAATKTITITNNSSQAQDIGIAVTKYTDPDILGSKLNTVIKKGAAELYGGAINPKNLADLFSAGEVHLDNLGSGLTATYDFEVTFNSQADNNFQGKTSIFDFNLGFTAKPAPAPIPTTPLVLGEETQEPAPAIKVLGTELPVTGADILKLASIWASFALTLAILPKIVNTVEKKKSKSRKY